MGGRRLYEALYVLFGAIGCVLLIACLNVATLSLGRAAARRTELATRLALGAGRRRVFRQLLTESVLLALLGGVLGVGLAVAGIKLFIALAASVDWAATDEIQIDGTVLGFTVALSFVTGIVSGVAPALRSSAVNLTDSLKAAGRGTPGARHRITDVLVVAEAALALVLLVGAGLTLNSFVRLVRVDPGFPSEQLLTVNFDLQHEKYVKIDSSAKMLRFTPRAAIVQQRLLERIERSATR